MGKELEEKRKNQGERNERQSLAERLQRQRAEKRKERLDTLLGVKNSESSTTLESSNIGNDGIKRTNKVEESKKIEKTMKLQNMALR